MPRRYLGTLNVGREFLGENARRSFRAAARRWGAQYLEVLTDAHLGEALFPTPTSCLAPAPAGGGGVDLFLP
jgi:hypothetical protein